MLFMLESQFYHTVGSSIAVQTVSFLHNANILHNDIKGDNFILGTMKQNHF